MYTIVKLQIKLYNISYYLFSIFIKHAFINEEHFYPNHPVGCIITGPSECGISVFLPNLVLNIINEYNKIYIYSPSLHQDLYQKLKNCFSNYIPIHIIPNILNEEDIDIIMEESVNN